MELSPDEKRFGDLFYKAVIELDEKHFLNIGQLQKSELIKNNQVRSLLDAEELCEVYGIDYLVYGYYKKTYNYIEAEIRVYDRELNGHKKIFYAKAEPEELELILTDLSQRLVAYLHEILGIAPEVDEQQLLTTVDGIQLHSNVGYWTPLAEWFDVMSGIIKGGLGMLIEPDALLFYSKHWLVTYRFGIVAEYMFGMSKPGLEDSYLHSAQLGIPFHLCALIHSHHQVYLGLMIYYKHDFIYQIRIFADPAWEDSGSFGGAGMAGYEYWWGEDRRFAFGAECKLEADFYENIPMAISLDFTFKYRFPFREYITEQKGGN